MVFPMKSVFLVFLFLFSLEASPPPDLWIKLNIAVAKVKEEKTAEAIGWIQKAKAAKESAEHYEREKKIELLKDSGHYLQQAVRAYRSIQKKIETTGDQEYQESLVKLWNEIQSKITATQVQIHHLLVEIDFLIALPSPTKTSPTEEPPEEVVCLPPAKIEEHLPYYGGISHSVDLIKGTFLLEETDLDFPVRICRAYNTEHCQGLFGRGWKMEFNPHFYSDFQFSYNSLGYISEIIAPDGRTIKYHHNLEGELLQVVFWNGLHIFYEYDSKHRLIREIKTYDKTLEIQYDTQGRVIAQRAFAGLRKTPLASLSFSYSEGSTHVKDEKGVLTQYHFSPLGFPLEISREGTLLKVQYEKNKKSKVVYQEAGKVPQEWDYFYNDYLLEVSKDSKGNTHKYTYDANNRLITDVTDTGGRCFSYDPKGLLISAEQWGSEHTVVKRTYNERGQIIEEETFLNGKSLGKVQQVWTPSTRTLLTPKGTKEYILESPPFLVDDPFRPFRVVRPKLPENTLEEQEIWDAWSHLIEITSPTFSYKATYDALGRCIQSVQSSKKWLWNDSLTTHYLYDPETGEPLEI